MGIISRIFRKSSQSDPRATHRLFKLPVTITIEIPVAAPSLELAADPLLVTAAWPHILSDLESLTVLEISAGNPSDVGQLDELQTLYHEALPYEHPAHPTSRDLDCREWLGQQAKE